MKRWQISKAILYVSAAVALIVFNKSVMPYVGVIVGAVVCAYATEELIISAVRRTLFVDTFHLFDGIAQVLVGTLLFIVSEDIIKVCLVWGVWSILRESKELAEAVNGLARNKFQVLNILESLTVIVLSFVIVIEPSEVHANLHVILLGVELITVVAFYVIESVLKAKSAANKDDEKEITL